jgi:ketosteroid isomerase-like protein
VEEGVRPATLAAAFILGTASAVSAAPAKAPKPPKAPAKAAAPKAAKPSPTSDIEDVKKLIEAYVQAANLAEPELAALVWAKSPAISFVHPKGREVGWEAIKTNVYEKMLGEMFSERKLTVDAVAVHSYGTNVIWAEFDWAFKATLRKDGAPLAARGRETQVYKKGKTRWELVHVHYSVVP